MEANQQLPCAQPTAKLPGAPGPCKSPASTPGLSFPLNKNRKLQGPYPVCPQIQYYIPIQFHFPEKNRIERKAEQPVGKWQRRQRTACSQRCHRHKSTFAVPHGSAVTGTKTRGQYFQTKTASDGRELGHMVTLGIVPWACQKPHPKENASCPAGGTEISPWEEPGVPWVWGRRRAEEMPWLTPAWHQPSACRPDNHGLFGK